MFVFVDKNSWLLLGWNEGTCVCAREFMYSRPITGGTSRVEGKQNSLFPLGPVIKCLMYRAGLFKARLS